MRYTCAHMYTFGWQLCPYVCELIFSWEAQTLFILNQQILMIYIFNRKTNGFVPFCRQLRQFFLVCIWNWIKVYSFIQFFVKAAVFFFIKTFIMYIKFLHVQQLNKKLLRWWAQKVSIAALSVLDRSRLWYKTTINFFVEHFYFQKRPQMIIHFQFNLYTYRRQYLCVWLIKG